MSMNPYGNANYAYNGPSSSRSSPELEEQFQNRQPQWPYEATQYSGAQQTEKFAAPSKKFYEPSIRSQASDMRDSIASRPWIEPPRQGSVQSSEAGSLPSYHDSPRTMSADLSHNKSMRKQLDNDHRARVYLFMTMTAGMLLLFVIIALIWLKLELIKPKPKYGYQGTEDNTVRNS